MRTFLDRAARALAIFLMPIALLGFAVSSATSARAEKALEDVSNSAFKIFESRSEEGSGRSGRRARVTRQESNDDEPAPARRRARVASAASNDDEQAPARRRAQAVKQSSEDEPAPSRSRAKGRQVASLGGGDYSPPKPSRSLSGGGNINWAANAGCLNGSLRGAVAHVAANYGSVTVNSTCRSAGHNASVGGAPKSYHLSGDAVDLRVHGNISGAASYLASLGGGYKHYGGGLFHVDTGPRRSF